MPSVCTEAAFVEADMTDVKSGAVAGATKNEEAVTEPVVKKKKRAEPCHDVKSWFVGYAEMQRRLSGWPHAANWHRACALAPELFGGCNKDTVRPW